MTKKQNNPEPEKRRDYVEDVFEKLKMPEIGENITRVSVARLNSGRDVEKKISAGDYLEIRGWSSKLVIGAKVGDIIIAPLISSTGNSKLDDEDFFQVARIENGGKRLILKNMGTDHEGVVDRVGRKFKSHEYVYQVADRTGKKKKISLFDMAFRDRSLDTTDFFDDLVLSLPAQFMDVFDEIQIHKRAGGGGGKLRTEPSVFWDKKTIIISVDPDTFSPAYSLKEAKQTLYHELGHAIARTLKGNPHPGKKWSKAMSEDGNFISEYSEEKRYPEYKDHGEIEDFAEAVKLYLEADGAKNAETSPLRNLCKSRFDVLDSVFDKSQGQAKGIVESVRRKIFKQKTALDE